MRDKMFKRKHYLIFIFKRSKVKGSGYTYSVQVADKYLKHLEIYEYMTPANITLKQLIKSMCNNIDNLILENY